ncbi:hypothetical protein DFJ77DRAFT_476509 [Powellomyces hirtus]|nr:hypothetical protein DFJ77DRAFT_476509 [Powellomyces hirtus]
MSFAATHRLLPLATFENVKAIFTANSSFSLCPTLRRRYPYLTRSGRVAMMSGQCLKWRMLWSDATDSAIERERSQGGTSHPRGRRSNHSKAKALATGGEFGDGSKIRERSERALPTKSLPTNSTRRFIGSNSELDADQLWEYLTRPEKGQTSNRSPNNGLRTFLIRVADTDVTKLIGRFWKSGKPSIAARRIYKILVVMMDLGRASKLPCWTDLIHLYLDTQTGNAHQLHRAASAAEKMERKGFPQRHDGTWRLLYEFAVTSRDPRQVEWVIALLVKSHLSLPSGLIRELLGKHTREKDWNGAVRLYNSISDAGATLCAESYAQFLRIASRHGDANFARALYSHMTKAGVKPQIGMWNSGTWRLLYELAVTSRDPGQVEWVIALLVKSHLSLPSGLIRELLGKHTREKDWNGAVRLYDSISDAGATLCAESYAQFLIIASRRRDANFARALYSHMTKAGVKPQIGMWNSGLSAGRDHKKSTDSWLRAMHEINMKPDISTLTILVQHKLDNWSFDPTVFDLIEEILDNKDVDVDRIFFSTIIDYFVRHGRPRDAAILLKVMAKREVLPDASIYGAVMRGYLAQGDEGRAEVFMREMSEVGIKPDKFLSTKLIDGYLRDDNYAAAVRILNQMHIRDARDGTNSLISNGTSTTHADAYIMGSFLAYCARMNDADLAVNIFRDLKSHGIRPDVAAYTQLIQIFQDNFTAVQQLWLTMRTVDHVHPDARAFKAYLQSVVQNTKDFSLVKRVFDEMEQTGVTPDSGVFDVLLLAYAVDPRVAEKREKTFMHMRNLDIEPSLYGFNQLIRAYARAGDLIRMERYFHQISASSSQRTSHPLRPNSHSYGYVIAAFVRRGDWDKACEYHRLAAENAVSLLPQTLRLLDSVAQHVGSAAWNEHLKRIHALIERADEPVQQPKHAGLWTDLSEVLNTFNRDSPPPLKSTADAAAQLSSSRPCADHSAIPPESSLQTGKDQQDSPPPLKSTADAAAQLSSSRPCTDHSAIPPESSLQTGKDQQEQQGTAAGPSPPEKPVST